MSVNSFDFTFSTGYAFLLYLEEQSVQKLIDACFQQDDKLYLCVSSPTIKDKPVSPHILLWWKVVITFKDQWSLIRL